MAKRSTKPWASQPAAKPAAMRRHKADRPATAPKAPKIPDTQEDLMAQIAIEFAAVDEIMAAPRKYSTNISRYSHGAIGDHFKKFEDLKTRLNKVLNPKGDRDGPDCDELIRTTFSAELGTVPKWSHRGEFIVWIGYIPCRCVWGGMVDNSADILAVDPAEPFPSAAGAGGVGGRLIDVEHKTPYDLFATSLKEQTLRRATTYRRGGDKDLGPAFKLLKLSEEGRSAAEKELARPENAWLVAALARGPVNAIPLPDHLKFVQLSWVD